MDAQRPGALTPTSDERVRATGLRSTRQRVTVLDTLDSIGGHRTADELVSELGRLGTALPRSTVFNVLDDLVEVGLVLRADLGSGAARYESAAIAGPHHHFVCRGCGAIEDVEVDQIGLIAWPSDPRFEVESLQVVLRGRCRTCRIAAPAGDRG